MYSVLPSFVLGFHGCDREVAERVIRGGHHLQQSRNKYDWLGEGIYFWENSPARALEYATMLMEHPRPRGPRIRYPAVVGATIDPGYCLNLLDTKFLLLLRDQYEVVATARRARPESSSRRIDLRARMMSCCFAILTVR